MFHDNIIHPSIASVWPPPLVGELIWELLILLKSIFAIIGSSYSTFFVSYFLAMTSGLLLPYLLFYTALPEYLL